MQQKHRQTSQPKRAKTADKAISGAAGTLPKRIMVPMRKSVPKQRSVPKRKSVPIRKGLPKADHIGRPYLRSGVFTRFQQLPCELRLMVWEAATTPRLVAVIPKPCPKDRDEASNYRKRETSLVRGIPPLLAVNKESRHFALGHYTWRFTIEMTISDRQRWGPTLDHRRARVVMSPDDTLGLFTYHRMLESHERLWHDRSWRERFWISKFDVKASNDETSPWRVHESTDAPNHGFKKVAILGDEVESNLYIVRALNVTLWDLDSILHAQSAEMRMADSPHTKHKILVKSGKTDVGPTDLAPEHHRLFLGQHRRSPDVLAYELADGEKGAEDLEKILLMLCRRPPLI